MGSGPRFPRHLVEPEVRWLLGVLFDRAVVCGSFRRGCAGIGDIDLVLDGLDTQSALDALIGHGLELISRDTPRCELSLPVDWMRQPLKVDVWTPREGALGACLLHATGPGMGNAVMRRWAFQRGLSLTWQGVRRLCDDEWIAGATEEECCDAIDWPYMPPEHRERFPEWIGPYLEIMNAAE